MDDTLLAAIIPCFNRFRTLNLARAKITNIGLLRENALLEFLDITGTPVGKAYAADIERRLQRN